MFVSLTEQMKIMTQLISAEMALLFYEVFMIELEQKELTQEQLVEVKSPSKRF